MSTLRGGFDRGLGGSAEATAGAQYAALAQAAAELSRAWAQAAAYVEPDPENYPGRYSSFHYSLLAAGGQWFRGPGAPAPELGEDGNYYLDETTGDLYQKVTGTWILALNIKGPGVPLGGTTRQVLVKASNANLDTEWITGVVPEGGLDGTVLTKLSDTSGDYGWVNPPGGGSGAGMEFYFQSGTVDGVPVATAPGAEWVDTDTGIKYTWVDDGDSTQWVEWGPSRTDPAPVEVAVPKVIQLACSDETTALTAGTAKVTFRMPHSMTLTGVRASLTTAQTSGSIFTVDINASGISILSTKLTIDNTEKTSTTAATPAVISGPALSDDAEITVDIDQIGDGTATGLKITLIGT